jgi:hypothetical protein
VCTAEESQQIYDALDKIDRGLAKIGETLKESKAFWEGIDQKLRLAPSIFAAQMMKDSPDGLTTGPEARLSGSIEPSDTYLGFRNFVLNARPK